MGEAMSRSNRIQAPFVKTFAKLCLWGGCLAIITVSAACARKIISPESESGYITLGAQSAEYWGLVAGTRYHEVRSDALTSEVAAATSDWLVQRRYEPRCARYFDAGELFLVVATAFCPSTSAGSIEPEHAEIAAFSSRGAQQKMGISDSWDRDLRVFPQRGTPERR